MANKIISDKKCVIAKHSNISLKRFEEKKGNAFTDEDRETVVFQDALQNRPRVSGSLSQNTNRLRTIRIRLSMNLKHLPLGIKIIPQCNTFNQY